ncbi:hypothetical protein [Flavobacterium sp.]|uniref:hypothetical protein n=1 Tax=Flavobacterium sp. TaxID=239 RepID=UPI001B435096|nr:hypothetical protein [Flavobacterium sp.]MBP6127333.1 hypothetical protein [Flavobacterium sp.]
MENTIEFKGPFNINHLDNHLEQKLKNPGIYIWGFKFYKNSDGNIGEPVDFNYLDENKEKIFIPYYVGMATGKGEKNNVMTIIKRLNQHKDVRNNDNAIKYTRLSMQYLKIFFNDPDFPIKTSNIDITNKFIEIDKSDENKKENGKQIEYYNNSKFLDYKIADSSIDKTKINKDERTNNPITNFSTLNDTLDELIIIKNNFWFCYAECSYNKGNENEITAFYESLESLTYYSLKGKTISKVKRWKGVANGDKIKDETNTNIFKDEPSTEFPGY